MIDVYPTRFYLRSAGPPTPLSVPPSPPAAEPEIELVERQLHPFLAYFAKNGLGGARVKTIHHELSLRGGYMKWVHPDLVGFTHPEGDWQDAVIELGTSVGPAPVTLLSFEMKRELNFGNLGNSFFEAVSNSSWAHQGYLAATEISDDEEFREELQRLSTEHGLGVIELDLSDPDNSRELYPPRRRELVGWSTVSKLCRANPEFAAFVDAVNRVLKGGRIRDSDYDEVLTHDGLLASLRARPVNSVAPPRA